MSTTKPNLNKELMHKLRSMTETIKVLSEENELLVIKNQQLLQINQKNEANNSSNKKGNQVFKLWILSLNLIWYLGEKLKHNPAENM